MTPLLPCPVQPGSHSLMRQAMQMNCQCYTEIESYGNHNSLTVKLSLRLRLILTKRAIREQLSSMNSL
jgi:hypothetical protein